MDQGAIGVRINVSDEPDIIKFPGKVDSESGQTIVKDITTGENHSCFLMQNGIVFSCGKNTQGQLGIGFFSDKEFRPIVVRLRNNLDQIK